VRENPDPLGKRALYWMPVEPADRVDPRDRVGPADRIPSPRGWATTPGSPRAATHGRSRVARPSGKHALFSMATPADEPEEDVSTVAADDEIPSRGMVSVACSSCGSVSRVGLVDFVLLHLPFAAWLPLRTYDRWMTCPACRRRTWTSVTLAR
jgi:hypothetical protein